MCVLLIVFAMPGFTSGTRAQQPDVSAAPTAPSPFLTRPVAQDVVALSTTASLDRFGGYFRLTHRFARDLRGPLGQLARSAFGLDDGAIIGLEYRFAPAGNMQLGVHRSLLYKTIQIFARHDTLRQSEHMPVAVSVIGSLEGTNNMRAQHSQSLGLVVSRMFGDRLAAYLSPMMVWNSQIPVGVTGHEHHDHGVLEAADGVAPAEKEQTFVAGLGGRLRLRPTVFIVGEFIPRAGFSPGAHQWSAGIEKRTDGHQFQLNVSNSFGTTHAQIARGGQPGNVYLGFNLARKF